MRSKFALRNMTASLLLQFVTMVCGMIVPRLFLVNFGSTVNATVASITQFLGYIALFEAGVGGVVRAALYKPLADHDAQGISRILRATDGFFRKVAFVFIGYSVVVACVFPMFVREHFDFFYTACLVLIIALSTFSQYYFGMSRQVLLQADQKRYITADLQILTVLLNTVLTVILLKLHCSVHIVKLGTAVLFALRPIVLRFYVRRHYAPDVHAEPDTAAIAQRWDGFGHHTAYFLHTNTDVFVLTVFSGVLKSLALTDVSVYTVYYSVVSGVERIVSAVSSGIEAAFGNMIALEEQETLQRNFRVYELFSFVVTTILFTCTGLLLLPFLSVYTRDITDADYSRPLFGVLLTLAEAVYCIRIPYNNVTLAAGHYRQTRNGAFLEAGINIVGSVLLVIPFGINGVAMATLLAMTVRTVQYAVYLSKHILNRPLSVFLGRVAVNSLSSGVCIVLFRFLPHPQISTYAHWIFYAIPVFAGTVTVVLFANLLCYRTDAENLWNILKHSLQKRRTKS